MWDETKIRVRYAETDQMGVVHHAAYYIWFELGRSDFCRHRGFSYREMENDDQILMVVAESNCKYRSPAFYDDLLTVRTSITELRSRGMTFEYSIFRESDATILASGATRHIFTNREKKIARLPQKYRDILNLPPSKIR